MKLNIPFKYKVLYSFHTPADKVALVQIDKGANGEYVVWNVRKDCSCDNGAYFQIGNDADDAGDALALALETLKERIRRLIEL